MYFRFYSCIYLLSDYEKEISYYWYLPDEDPRGLKSVIFYLIEDSIIRFLYSAAKLAKVKQEKKENKVFNPIVQDLRYLKGHKFMVRFGCPSIDFDAVFQSNDKKLDAFIFYNAKVNSTLQVSNIDPSITPLYLL